MGSSFLFYFCGFFCLFAVENPYSIILRDDAHAITDYRYGRKWDIPFLVSADKLSPQAGPPRQTLPPVSEPPPRVQKMPAKIEAPPTSVSAGFLFPSFGRRWVSPLREAVGAFCCGIRFQEKGIIAGFFLRLLI
jgi:hypothetical protein